MSHTHNKLPTWFWVGVSLVFFAVPHQTMAQQVTPILVVDGLKCPTSVAIQPETGTIFIAESGAQRIIKIADGKVVPVVEGFGKDAYGKNPIYEIGPLGMMFLNKDVLVVGGGGAEDGEDQLMTFKLDADKKLPLKASEPEQGARQLKKTGDLPAEGDFYALAKGTKGIYVTCNGDDTKGWIGRAIYNQEFALTSLIRAIATYEATETTAPMAITFNSQGHLVVGQMGKTGGKKDSLLCFYSEEGAHLDTFKLDLFDITGLAYGPKHGRLFATDFHWDKPGKGGLYKIIGTKDVVGCKCQLISQLSRPTSLAFTPDGDLYVTLAGDPNKPAADGKLVVFKEMDVDLLK